MQSSETEPRLSKLGPGTIRSRTRDWLVVAAVAASILVAVGLAIGLVDRVSAHSTSLGAGGSTMSPITGDPNALMLAGRAGDVLVGLAVRRGGPVDITAIAPDLRTLTATAVHVTAGRRALTVTSCGADCFRARVNALRGRRVPLAVRVERGGKPPGTARFLLPPGPTRPAANLLRRVDRRMERLRSVRVDETLSSGLTTISTRFQLQAPNRLSYAIVHGGRAIVIGARRWDFANGRWQKSETETVQEPTYIWQGARRARLIGRTTMDGQPVRVLAAFRPSTDFPAWFRLLVASDGRVLEAHMLAPAHFMVDRFTAFDQPLAIEPPR